MKKILYSGIFLLFLLHNDLWYWTDASLYFGLPAGLLYHIAFCVAASLLMYALVRFAWPTDLDSDGEKREAR